MSAAPHHSSPVGLVGLGLGALAGVLGALACGYDWARGPERFSPGDVVFSYPVGVAAVGIVGAILITTTIVMPWTWARVTGIGLVATFGTIYAILVIAARSVDDFEVDADIDLLTGAGISSLAFGLSAAGLLLAILGDRPRPALPASAPAQVYSQPYGPPDPGYASAGRLPSLEAPPPPPARTGTSGKAIASLVLGILGVVSIVAPPLAALAVAFANLGRADIRASGNRKGGNGMAVAGLVLGIVGLALSVIILAALMATLPPSDMSAFE